MKRLMVIAVCLSVLYAGAVSAFAECASLITAAGGHDHGENSDGHRHDPAAAPQGSDSEKIHCPSLFGAFVVASRISVKTERRVAAAVDYQVFDRSFVWEPSTLGRFDLGPPGSMVSQSRPLHLLLSVIRI